MTASLFALPRVPRGAWRLPQDLHDAVGLGFQWGGSHSNGALLRCLGMDTRNVPFTGQRKQPVIVPVFAASLVSGLMEILSVSQMGPCSLYSALL
uniref:Aftiphilin clathrin-binding box domain-containing protein n=1 Tax=Hucho hucho TaxID=62062 RepID=A0A4W5LL94_9TELE